MTNMNKTCCDLCKHEREVTNINEVFSNDTFIKCFNDNNLNNLCSDCLEFYTKKKDTPIYNLISSIKTNIRFRESLEYQKKLDTLDKTIHTEG